MKSKPAKNGRAKPRPAPKAPPRKTNPAVAKLRKSNAELKAKVNSLTEENAYLQKAVLAMMDDLEVGYTKKELLSFVGQRPTMAELIAEIDPGRRRKS